MKNLNLLLFIIIFGLVPYTTYSKQFDKPNAIDNKDLLWENFRNKFNYHIQLVGVKKYDDNSVNIILAEPPSRISIDDIKSKVANIGATFEIKKWRIGVDGWVKDIVITGQNMSKFQLDNFLSEINEALFYTSYKADYLDLNNLSSFSVHYSEKNLNYEFTSAELNKWFLLDKQLFYPNGKIEDKNSIASILAGKKFGEYFSQKKGFVLWVLPRNQDITKYVKTIRQFTLDSDLIIGAISDGQSIAIIGRERNESVYTLPPLRVETILLLAASNKLELGQSYERNSMFAGKLNNLQDWAPIYLCDELINTEYGSLLNITDQMLKSWSQNGQIKYENFNYPNPQKWAFENPIFDELKTTSLTYNWNTKGVGYSVRNGNFQIYSLNRTGSLPMTYIPDALDIDESLSLYEEKGYDYFSKLNNCHLVRVVQYSSLYQIFSNYNIVANKSNLSKNEKAKDVLTTPSVKFLKIIQKKDQSTIVKQLYGSEFNKDFSKLISNLKTYYNTNGEQGMIELAKLVNDRNELKRIDKNYVLLQKLESDIIATLILGVELENKHNELVSEHNKLVLKYNKANDLITKSQIDFLKESIDDYKRKLDPMVEELNEKQVKIKVLSNKTNEKEALKSEILKNIDLARELIELSVYERDSIKNQYSESWEKVNNNNWIKTPSIVISQDTMKAYMTGGHNIDAGIDEFIFDNTLKKGKIRIATINGKRQLKINSSDINKVNSGLLNNFKYVDNRYNSTYSNKKIENYFTKSKEIELKNIEQVFDFQDINIRGYESQQNIGWKYGDNSTLSNTLTIKKNIDNTYLVNDRKTTTCYNLKEAVEDYLQNQPNKAGIIEFENFTKDEANYFTQNVEIKFMNKKGKGWLLYDGKKQEITSKNYDFTKKTETNLENGNIEFEFPMHDSSKKAKLSISGLAQNLMQKIKSIFEKVFGMAEKNPNLDIAKQLKKEFDLAGIPFDKIIISTDDCVICYLIYLKNGSKC